MVMTALAIVTGLFYRQIERGHKLLKILNHNAKTASHGNIDQSEHIYDNRYS